MADHHKLNLTGYDEYGLESIGRANEDLTKVVYNAPSFPFLDVLRSLDRLITFEKILVNPIHEDNEYQRVRD